MGEVLFKRVFLLFLLVYSVVVFSVGVFSAVHPLYSGFSSANSGFGFNNNTGLVSVSDTAVYRVGYYSVNGGAWQSFNLSGSSYNGDVNWLSGSTSHTLPVFGVGEHYVIVYSCTHNLSVSSWDCHDNKWQLIIINHLVNTSDPDPGPSPDNSSCRQGEYNFNGTCLLNVTGNTYFVAVNGNDNNPGTFELPWGTWQKAFDTAEAGDIVYFRGGTWYPTSKLNGGTSATAIDPSTGHGHNGTAENPIRFYAYPADYASGNIPTLDCINITDNVYGNIALVIQYATYIEFKGLTVANSKMYNLLRNSGGISAAEFGVLRFENMVSHDNGGAGIWARTYQHVTFINCDSYNNNDVLDTTSPGGDGDGFVASSRGLASDTYKTTTVIGCRAWNNSDDGFDFGTTKQLYIRNTWSFSNGVMGGDGTGIKLSYGHVLDTNQRIITNCITADNQKADGTSGGGIVEVNLYDETYGPIIAVYDWLSYKDHMGFTSSDSWSPYNRTYYKDILKNNIIYKTVSTDYPDTPATFKAADYTDGVPSYVTLNNNTFKMQGVYGNTVVNPAFNVTDDDFISLDTSQLMRPRKADGSLPDITFGHLVQGSDLIDAGTIIPGYHCSTVGAHPGENCREWYGNAPDLGPFESNY